MNFWSFIDKHAEGIGMLIFFAFLFLLIVVSNYVQGCPK